MLLLMLFGRLIVLESLYYIVLHENERYYSVINCIRMCNRLCRQLPKIAVNEQQTTSLPSHSLCVCLCIYHKLLFGGALVSLNVQKNYAHKKHKYSSQNRQQLSLKYYSFSLVHISHALSFSPPPQIKCIRLSFFLFHLLVWIRITFFLFLFFLFLSVV